MTQPTQEQLEWAVFRNIKSRAVSMYNSTIPAGTHNLHMLHFSELSLYQQEVWISKALATALAEREADQRNGGLNLTLKEFQEVMQDEWNEICFDTDCHPLDIEQLGRRKLLFSPSHWAAQIFNRIRHLAEREADGWNYNMEDAKALPKDARFMLRVNQHFLSPCWWSPRGEISEDGCWCWMQSLDNGFFVEVLEPTAFKLITLPPAKETE